MMANFVAASLALLLVAGYAAASAVPGGRLNDEVNRFEALELEPHALLRRNGLTRELQLHSAPFTLTVEAFDTTFVLDLKPDTSLFTPSMNTTIQGHDGQVWSLDDRRYYTGRVRNHDNSFVHLRIALDGTAHGNFYCDNEAYAVEPAAYHFKEKMPFRHVIYRLSDHDEPELPLNHETCRAMSPNFTAGPDDVARQRRAVFNSANTVCDVALVADFQFYTVIGDSDIGKTIDKMTSRFASAQNLFANQIEVQNEFISLKIGLLEVVTDNSDTRYVNVGNSGVDFLDKFSTHDWSDYCLAFLMTYQEFENGLLGLAWVGRAGSTPGGICQGPINSGGLKYTNTAFATQRTFNNKKLPDLTFFLVMAHEFGHNFGSDHDSASNSPDGNFLMFPVSVDGSKPNNFLFSSQSVTSIVGVVTNKGGCFETVGADQCSNGLQEGAEECDCGTASVCPTVDSCCNVFANDVATDCKLAIGADCSPFHVQNGACCTTGCDLEPDSKVCREETECTEEVQCSSGVCATAPNFPENTVCDASSPARMCDSSASCTKSICLLWDLTDVLVVGSNACMVTCDVSGVPTTTDNLGAVTNDIGLTRSGAQFVPSGAISRAAGDQCRLTSKKFGICDDTGTCRDASGGKTAFDRVEKLLKSFDIDDAVNWLQSEDAYIPNWGWVAIGVGVLIILITMCCYCSNKMDKKHGVV